jgi:hypothetical protein
MHEESIKVLNLPLRVIRAGSEVVHAGSEQLYGFQEGSKGRFLVRGSQWRDVLLAKRAVWLVLVHGWVQGVATESLLSRG